jgi:hypothetical protein
MPVRIWIFLAMWMAVTHCAQGQLESIIPEVEAGVKSGRVFVSTNRHHVPFYLVDNDLDLVSKLGTKVSTNDVAGVFATTEAEQSIRRVNGNTVLWSYYRQRGRYSLLKRNRLTLVEFELIISQSGETRGQLVYVSCGSKAFTVSASFLQTVKRLTQSGSTQE